ITVIKDKNHCNLLYNHCNHMVFQDNLTLTKITMKIRFVKMQSGGNDFVLIDNRKSLIRDRAKLARKLCLRKFSIGADGFLLLENSKTADFRMRIYNSDGSEAEMCGNGIRCLIKFIYSEKLAAQKEISIETKDAIYYGKYKKELISVRIREPKKVNLNLNLKIKEKKEKVFLINVGVPHTIVFVKNLKKIDVKSLGSLIRYHQQFSPAGTNVDFVRVVNRHALKIRIYERGVEDETFSCGTGATAAAIISYKLGRVKSPVKVFPIFGKPLKIHFDPGLKEIYLEGEAIKVYEGECLLSR
ncbi:MAG: diaminopimelate epimerase, partial [bacterium (Candidatus Ratteibacteria) CG_4_10_14_3_um_filter_41_18]